jgi:uncharacterized cupin superfamily protein
MPKIDIAAAELRTGSRYPPPFDEPCRDKTRRPLGDAAGLSQFGVNLLRLPPGQWSAQRHWHTVEDEFVWVLEGEVVLVTDEGDQVLRAGECAGFPGGVANGHHLQNRAATDAVVLEVGTRDWKNDACDYPDIDMMADEKGYLHRDGRRYPHR